MTARVGARRADALRPIVITRHFTKHAEGSVLIAQGDTQVLCTASVEETVPAFMKGRGEGWITAEYGMLPRSTHTRTRREAAEGVPFSRDQLDTLVALGERGIRTLIAAQKAALET